MPSPSRPAPLTAAPGDDDDDPLELSPVDRDVLGADPNGDADDDGVAATNAGSHGANEPSPRSRPVERRGSQVFGYRAGRELFYRLRQEVLYSEAEDKFIAKRFAEINARVKKGIAPKVALICDHDLHFLANAVLLTLLGCEVTGCRNLQSALNLVAPQSRGPAYEPHDLVIIEKTKRAEPVDFNLRDMCFNIRSRDSTYTRDTGYVSRTNILAMEASGVTVFDAGDSTADLILRGTLFRNLSLLRVLLLPASIRNQGRLQVHRATSNYKRIEQLLVAAPQELDREGRVKLDDAETQALAAQRLAGGLEEEILYLRDVVRQRDKELKAKNAQLHAQTQGATESDHKWMEVEVTLRREKEEALEETNRVKGQLQRAHMETRGAQHQLKIVQAQFEQKVKLQRLRGGGTSPSKKKTAAGEDEEDPTTAALRKIELSQRVESRSDPTKQFKATATQCILVGKSIDDAPASPNLLTASGSASAVVTASRVFGDPDEIPCVAETIDVPPAAKLTYTELEAELAKVRAEMVAARDELTAAKDQANHVGGQLLDAQTKLKTAVLEKREAVGVADKLRGESERHSFEVGRLEEAASLAKADRDSAEERLQASLKEIMSLQEEKSVIAARLKDDESSIVDMRTSLRTEFAAKVELARKEERERMQGVTANKSRELLMRCVLLAALERRGTANAELKAAIAAAENRVSELKAAARQEKKQQQQQGDDGAAASTKKGGAQSKKGGAVKAGKSSASTKDVATEMDPAKDLMRLFEKNASVLLETENRLQRVQGLYEDAKACVKPLEQDLAREKADKLAAIKAREAAEEASAKAAAAAERASEDCQHHQMMTGRLKSDILELQGQLSATQSAFGHARDESKGRAEEIAKLETAREQLAQQLALSKEELKTAAQAAGRERQQQSDTATKIVDHEGRDLTQRVDALIQEERKHTRAAEQLVKQKQHEIADLQAKIKELKGTTKNLHKSLKELEKSHNADAVTSLGDPAAAAPQHADGGGAAAADGGTPPALKSDTSASSHATSPSKSTTPQSRSPTTTLPPATSSGAPFAAESPGVAAVSSRRSNPEHEQSMEASDAAATLGEVFGRMEQTMVVANPGSPMNPGSPRGYSDSSASHSPKGTIVVTKTKVVTNQRMVVGDVDETVVKELKASIEALEADKAALEDKNRALKRELGESRGLVGAYKESQVGLLQKKSEHEDRAAQQAAEIERLSSIHQGLLQGRARLADMRERVVETMQRWMQLYEGGAPFDVEDDGSERWSIAASQHVIDQALNVLDLWNRSRMIRSLDNMTQTPSRGLRRGSDDVPAPPQTDDIGIQARAPGRDFGTYMPQSWSEEAECQTDPVSIGLPPPPSSSRQSTRGGGGGQRPPSDPQQIADPPAGQRNVSSRQLPGSRSGLDSRDRSTRRRLSAIDAAAFASSQRSGTGGGAPAFETLFETATQECQTGDELLEPILSRWQRARTASTTASRLGTAATAQGAGVSLGGTLSTRPPRTPLTTVPEGDDDENDDDSDGVASMRDAAGAFDVEQNMFLSGLRTPVGVGCQIDVADVCPQCAELEATLQTVRAELEAEKATLSKKPTLSVSLGRSDHGVQAIPPTANSVAQAVATHRSAASQVVASEMPGAAHFVSTHVQAVEAEQLAGTSVPNAAALSKLVAAAASMHRTLHTLFMKTKHAVPTAADLKLQPVSIIANSRAAVEALTSDSVTATQLVDCITRFVKSRRAAAVKEHTNELELAKAARGGGHQAHITGAMLDVDGAEHGGGGGGGPLPSMAADVLSHGSFVGRLTTPPPAEHVSVAAPPQQQLHGRRARAAKAAAPPAGPVYHMAPEPAAADAAGSFSGPVSFARGLAGGGRQQQHQQQQQMSGFARSLSPPVRGGGGTGTRQLPPMAATPDPRSAVGVGSALSLGGAGSPVGVSRGRTGQLPSIGGGARAAAGARSSPAAAAAGTGYQRGGAPRQSSRSPGAGGAHSSPARAHASSPSPLRVGGGGGGNQPRQRGPLGRLR